VAGSCSVSICGTGNGLALSPSAYSDVGTGAATTVSWNYVACPVTGTVYARVEATGMRVVILNHAYGIAKVETQDPVGTWLPCTRQLDNSWLAPVGLTVSGHAVRVTDVNGGVVTGNLILSPNDQMLDAQFPMCVP
jgi:expansin (peptidoglycan-binding protein)